jgi:hypothetical protein
MEIRSGCTLPSFRAKPNVTFVGRLTPNGQYRHSAGARGTIHHLTLANPVLKTVKLDELNFDAYIYVYNIAEESKFLRQTELSVPAHEHCRPRTLLKRSRS